jgi:Domain of unknown function (DUF4411)
MWARLDRLMDEGRIIIPREVVDEVGLHGDPLDQWVHDHREAHYATEGVWDEASRIANAYTDLVDRRKKIDADAFVVATALVEKADRALRMFEGEVIVVSEERSKLPSKVSIRDASNLEGIRCLNLNEWFEEEDVRV